MALFLYNLLLPVVFLLYAPFYLVKLVRRGNFLHHFGERFGIYSSDRKAQLRALSKPVWIHAVSVGEVVAAISFINAWSRRRPDLQFVLSTTTTTGHATARVKLPQEVSLIYCPLDFPFVVARVLNLVRPVLLVVFEVEIWPNLIVSASRRGIPIALANGRMSDRSAHGYRRHRWFFAPIFSRFSALCVQTEADAQRIRSVSAPDAPVHVCNTMKYDQVPDRRGADTSDVLRRSFGPEDHLILTAGSTHPGEEALIAAVYKRLKADFGSLRLVLVPRHHERTARVAQELDSQGLSYCLLCPREDLPGATPPVDVLVVNTTGELMRFYEASDIVVVGKSLAGNSGGHNIIEPAIFGKPVLYGDHLDNFRSVSEDFRDADAGAPLADDSELEPALRRLLESPQERGELGARARKLVEQKRGAVARTIDVLDALLPSPRLHRDP